MGRATLGHGVVIGPVGLGRRSRGDVIGPLRVIGGLLGGVKLRLGLGSHCGSFLGVGLYPAV